MKTSIPKLLLVLCISYLLWGCAAAPPPKKEQPYVFFPKLPDPPRIQFLTSITSATDFITAPQQSSFADFIVGKKKKLPKKVSKPYGVAIKDGIIYLCDTEVNAITMLDLVGQKFSYLGAQTAQGL